MGGQVQGGGGNGDTGPAKDDYRKPPLQTPKLIQHERKLRSKQVFQVLMDDRSRMKPPLLAPKFKDGKETMEGLPLREEMVDGKEEVVIPK